jgi:hypothetical protein
MERYVSSEEGLELEAIAPWSRDGNAIGTISKAVHTCASTFVVLMTACMLS